MNSSDYLSGHPVTEQIPPEQPPEQRVAPHAVARPQPVLVAGVGFAGTLPPLLGTVVISGFMITFILQAFQIPSPYMESTLLVGDYLLVNKLCYGAGGW